MTEVGLANPKMMHERQRCLIFLQNTNIVRFSIVADIVVTLVLKVCLYDLNRLHFEFNCDANVSIIELMLFSEVIYL